MGVRYMKHNIKDVGGFIHRFFNDANYFQGTMSCASFKLSTMRLGQINWGENKTEKHLEFFPFPTRRTTNSGANNLTVERPNASKDVSQPNEPGTSHDHTTQSPDSHPLNTVFADLLSWFNAYYANRPVLTTMITNAVRLPCTTLL